MHSHITRGSYIAAIAMALLVSACAPAQQPASSEQVAAVEVPLSTAADRAALLAMLQRHARDGGLHVDDVSAEWRQFAQDRLDQPSDPKNVLTKTIAVGLWRGADDDDPEVFVDDGGHPGRPWLTFLKGKHPELATKVRTGLLAEIKGRWPETRDIPVMPNGALPLEGDLVWTGTTYVVKSERVSAYAQRGS